MDRAACTQYGMRSCSKKCWLYLSEKFRLRKAKFLSWCLDFLKHDYSFVLLPVHYVDKVSLKTPQGHMQVRSAVNGQTGKAAASFFNEKEEYYLATPIFCQSFTLNPLSCTSLLLSRKDCNKIFFRKFCTESNHL